LATQEAPDDTDGAKGQDCIALGLLVATGQLLPEQLKDFATVGELALDGSVRTVKGALSMAMAAASVVQARSASTMRRTSRYLLASLVLPGRSPSRTRVPEAGSRPCISPRTRLW